MRRVNATARQTQSNAPLKNVVYLYAGHAKYYISTKIGYNFTVTLSFIKLNDISVNELFLNSTLSVAKAGDLYFA